jgi:hypothetical protein
VLEREIERERELMLPASPWAVQVGRVRCLRGIDTLTAVGLCAEAFAQTPVLTSMRSERHGTASEPSRPGASPNRSAAPPECLCMAYQEGEDDAD